MGISNDPLTISLDKVLDLIRGLGLDPVEPEDIQRVTIDPYGVEVVRFRRDQAGRQVLLGFDEKPLTETVTIGIAP